MARSPQSSQHSFAQVPRMDTQRSSFDRSSNVKTAFNSGYLVPIFVDEALPGDTFSLNTTGLARLATPLHPYMDNVYINTFYFAVPMRLVWNNTEKFFGEQTDPGDSTDYLIPQIVAPAGGYDIGTIFDYMGIPTDVAALSHSALPLRAYNLIWNTWFRDQNLQDSIVVNKGDGPDAYTDYVLKRRGKRHDYFTSSLPWPQKGPAVDIPLGTKAPVMGLGPIATGGGGFTHATDSIKEAGGTTHAYPNIRYIGEAGTVTGLAQDPENAGFPYLFTDLSNATGATINQLRQAFAVQQLYEIDARGGTRYTEIIRAHFNVTSPDARLQRPEYLGGGQQYVNVHTVPQTSASDAQPTPQGNLSAYGIASGGSAGFTKSFTEHSIILGFVSVRADLTYQQGLNKMWSRRTKLDYFWPTMAHIGEQAVLMKEIYAQGTADDDLVWGYQERAGEYRYKPSIVTGVMRSTAPQSLDTWHLAIDFASEPALNAAFIEENPPIDRVIAVLDEPQFIYDCFHQLRCARPMPVYGVPGMRRL